MELDDLPEHRRRALLWRYAMELNREGVADLVRRANPRWCLGQVTVSAEPDPVSVAVLGDDGLHHLRVGDEYMCAQARRRADAPGLLRHTKRYGWWVDQDGLVVSEPRGPRPRGRGSRLVRERVLTVRWTIRLTDTVTEPDLVPYRMRCHRHYHWPPLRTTRNGLGRVRAALIEALGDRCQTCGRRGEVVDHDHFTGFVRGWLCKFCNHIVDDCPHPAGCPFAEYLNDPPATPLRLRHPKASDDARKPASLARIERLGYTPFT
ncbi:endonuclease domain-containing protein [Saccharothrix sp. NRRL B-16348]|uniref:endonuclease domain-containing protein n=1 Tax=Saccharothrix sp. NRRL B-16348 TaxID=1415542 RepID=UPI0018D170FD|nr:endonuclease domain-containing protein [Saccharothrix sp. NRRL B-16348]